MAFISGERQVPSSLTLPGSSTDNAVVRWDGTGATSIQDSGVTVDDTDLLIVPTGWEVSS